MFPLQITNFSDFFITLKTFWLMSELSLVKTERMFKKWEKESIKVEISSVHIVYSDLIGIKGFQL